MKNEKELNIQKLQNALLKLPKDELVKLLKNTYQVMKVKHNMMNNSENSSKNVNKTMVHGNYSKFSKVTNSNKVYSTNKQKQNKSSIDNKSNTNVKSSKLKNSNVNNNVLSSNVLDEVETTDSDNETINTNFNLNEENNSSLNNLEDENLMNKYLNLNENNEDVTFRSQEVEIPQLNLKKVEEYLKNKHKFSNNNVNEKRLVKNDFNGLNYVNNKDGEVLTPTFSFKRTNDNNSWMYNNQLMYSNPNAKLVYNNSNNMNYYYNNRVQYPYNYNTYNNNYNNNLMLFNNRMMNYNDVNNKLYYLKSKSFQR